VLVDMKMKNFQEPAPRATAETPLEVIVSYDWFTFDGVDPKTGNEMAPMLSGQILGEQWTRVSLAGPWLISRGLIIRKFTPEEEQATKAAGDKTAEKTILV